MFGCPYHAALGGTPCEAHGEFIDPRSCSGTVVIAEVDRRHLPKQRLFGDAAHAQTSGVNNPGGSCGLARLIRRKPGGVGRMSEADSTAGEAARTVAGFSVACASAHRKSICRWKPLWIDEAALF